ncbi:dihydrofolate reductase [Rhizobium sp. SSA_523]|uniref:dihydrofolate reductase n=1 Tax=Rhizobium sp. SSA_523 TaxID=2952477 RepID=UPI002091214F|nr:dihydrofolate reductase [Rhizobium sp. SSA_523]MCO5730260.1 dihydrofolate reductase [Rhizobium sp. SSA_523]WKC25315.1 dihydrofolate reductase [Rhizobium sp. SSA_523]
MTGPAIPLVLIAAVAQNNVIGRDGDMPWKLSTDLKRFKQMTLGKPVIVGRKTLESFGGRPLPGRPHVVVTRDPSRAVEGCSMAASLAQAIETARGIAETTGADEICVIGGGEIYAQAMDRADRLYITHVETVIADGDTVFPAIDPAIFEKVEESAVPAGERDTFPTRFAIYRRRTAAN